MGRGRLGGGKEEKKISRGDEVAELSTFEPGSDGSKQLRVNHPVTADHSL